MQQSITANDGDDGKDIDCDVASASAVSTQPSSA
jgi:hypothetical protein